MTYLYAALGLIMMSGIAAIFNMSLKISSQPTKSINPENKYQKNKFNQKDKIFLELLQSSDKTWGVGENLCNKITLEINNSNNNYSELANYQKTESSLSTNIRFLNSCTFAEGNHRVLIKPKSSNNDSYYYSSCFVENNFCEFEENNN